MSTEPAWRKDLKDSSRQFVDIVWPEIRDWFGSDIRLYPTENRDGGLPTAFDQVAGVDFWVVESGAGMLSLASRVQSYDETTFTIRYARESGADTEYQKRLRQLHSHHELPTYTIQAYVDPVLEVLRNAAAIRTTSLYEHVEEGTPGEEWPLIPSNESESFFPVSWRELDEVAELVVQDRQRAALRATSDETDAPLKAAKTSRPDNPEDITEWVTIQ